MERNHFKERTELRMVALGLNQQQVAELTREPRSNVAKAIQGYKTPAASSLRVKIDQALSRMAGEKRARMAEDVQKAASVQAPHLAGELSLILPEDMMYIVTEDGVPVGVWNPISKVYRAFTEV